MAKASWGPEWTRLAEAARAMLDRAYAPYSRFRVGAALESASGEIFAGCNVECASYGLTACAERVAAAVAVSRGHTRFRRLVVATDSDSVVPPCGACRQVLAEFADDLEVGCVGGKQRALWRLDELLPQAFRLERGP